MRPSRIRIGSTGAAPATADSNAFTLTIAASGVKKIYLGGTQVQSLNLGSTNIKEVYVGSTKVFG